MRETTYTWTHEGQERTGQWWCDGPGQSVWVITDGPGRNILALLRRAGDGWVQQSPKGGVK